MGQVAVGGVQFEPFITGRQCAAGRGDETGADPGDIFRVHRARGFGQLAAKGEGTRRDDRPTAIVVGQLRSAIPRASGGGLAAGVGDLDAGRGAVLLDEPVDEQQGLDVLVIPQPGTAGRDAALGRDRRGLRDHQAGPTCRPRPQMDQVPVSGHALVA